MVKRSFIGILTPSDISQIVNEWRAEYYPFGLRSVPAHVTIIPPYIPEKYIEKMYKEIEQTVNRLPKYRISIKSFGTFHHHSYTFFAKVEPTQELLTAHQAISLIMSKYRTTSIFTDYVFSPHITIANRIDKRQAALIQAKFQGLSLEYEFNAQQLSLLTKRGENYEIESQWELDKA